MRNILLAGAALASLAVPVASAEAAKNIIVMIADGAGFNTLQATRLFTGGALAVDGAGWQSMAQLTYALRTSTSPIAGAAGLQQDPNQVYSSAKVWDTTPVAGNSGAYPNAFQGIVYSRANAPDSGNTMSAMMTGVKSYNNAINVDGNGNPVLSLAEVSHNLGKATGVVTSVQFSDATPAAGGGAHNASRGDHAAIAKEMFGAGVLDVIAGTGNPDYNNDGQLRATPDNNWMPADLWSDLKNNTNVSGANAANWNLVQSRADIQAIANGTATPAGKVAMIAQAFDGTQEYRTANGGPDGASKATYVPFSGAAPFLTNTPTLWESTHAALNVLGQDSDGMFLMVEGGAVDRAMHSNNLGRMIEEYVDFNDAVQNVVDWVNSADSAATWDDTLLIVTADHDHNLWGPDGATIPFQDLVDNGAGNLPGHRWFGNGHSNNLVPLYAYGAGATDVRALADQIDVYTDAQGRTFGRGAYTDQAELGRFLQANVAGGVPEPGTWAMIVGGFGLLGGAMRRRQRLAQA